MLPTFPTLEAPHLGEAESRRLAEIARQVRRDSIRMVAAAASGHVGGPLGAAEILAVLYGHEMRREPRDRFVLSNGHLSAAYYSVMARVGLLPVEELATFRRINSRLQGHPSRHDLPDLVEASAGPLGQGLSFTNGLALADRLDGNGARHYCLVGDGELQEGQVWEAAMTAAHYRLASVTLIVADNGLQIDGTVENVKALRPIGERFRAFGWHVLEPDGHDINGLVAAFARAREEKHRPSVLVANTVMSKGVPAWEDQAAWHGKAPSLEEARAALAVLGESPEHRDFPIAGVNL
jgi:transketolase